MRRKGGWKACRLRAHIAFCVFPGNVSKSRAADPPFEFIKTIPVQHGHAHRLPHHSERDAAPAQGKCAIQSIWRQRHEADQANGVPRGQANIRAKGCTIGPCCRWVGPDAPSSGKEHHSDAALREEWQMPLITSAHQRGVVKLLAELVHGKRRLKQCTRLVCRFRR